MRTLDARLAPHGRRPAFVIVAVSFVDAVESSVVIGALPLLQDEWGFSDTWGGAIATASAIAGLIALLPAGWMADHLRRGRLLGVVLATWAVLTTGSALAIAFWMFFVIRVVLGGAMHLDNPPASSLLSDFYAPGLRGRVFAAQRLAFTVGIGVGIGIGGVVGDAFGWRAAFLLMVLPGLIVALLCWWLPDPPRGALDRDDLHDDATSTDRRARVIEELVTEPTEETHRPGGVRGELERIRVNLRIPSVRRLYFGLTVAFLGFNGLAFWLPTYFERTHDVSEAVASAVTAVAAIVAGLGGTIVGGVVGDRLAARAAEMRIMLIGASLAAGGITLLLALAVSVFWLQVLVIMLAAFLLTAGFPNIAAAAADVLPAATRGAGFALFTFLLTFGSALGPLIVGGVSDATGSLGLALAVSALPTLPGAVVVLRARKSIADDIASARGAGRASTA